MKARSIVAPAELAIAALVMAVVVMMIVPVPRPLLDGLLVLNIAFGVALLMATVFSPKPLQFASFPTLLVVTTLFRVGLEVSTTRLILADADAGTVVRAFGSSVVADSLVVGLVVFAVITLVQLIVVARGAERVAEVSARFALDAMPGKQMAIDAELRAGHLDAESARRRRTDLERESQLYGAMDGAMRFVKGDAIAAIVIVIINLIGGMVIGVGQRGMTAGDAVHTFSLLSIGAGLVAQIPSLLVAVASGLLVTRVASSGDRELGADVPAQLGPRALTGVAVLLVGLGLIPGLPFAPFVLLGALAAGAALLAFRRRPKPTIVLDEPGASRLALRLSPELHAKLAPRAAALHAALAAKRASIKAAVAIPPLAVEQDPSLAATELALAIDGTPVAWLTAEGDPLAAIDHLPLAQLAPELVDVDRVAALVERTAAHAPILVREVVPKLVNLPQLTEVVRALAREQVPVDDLAPLLEAIAVVPASKSDTAQLVDQLRSRLRRQITARWAPRGQLSVFTVDAMIEDAVRGAIDRRDGVQILALEPAIAADIVAAVRGKLGTGPAVILASGDIRRHLRTLLEPELPEIAILAAHELAPDTHVRTAGRIEV